MCRGMRGRSRRIGGRSVGAGDEREQEIVQGERGCEGRG